MTLFPVSDLPLQRCLPTRPASRSALLCASLQVSTVTVCVLRDAGAPTAPFPATVKMGLRAPPMMASVSVRQGSEAPLVREVSVSLGGDNIVSSQGTACRIIISIPPLSS